MTEQALLQQVAALNAKLDRVAGSHNTLVNKTVGDLDQHANVMRQLAAGLQSLEQRIVALEQTLRGGRPPVMQQPGTRAPMPVDGGVHAQPVPQPQAVPQPQPATQTPQHPMSAGWADDEEDAQLEE